jgi:LysR family transcriptional regulator, glycine cleavage system transcriptional activator
VSQRLTFLHYLPAFEAVVRLGSVRGAAQELNLSPSAVSLQMRKLAEATAIPLFVKQGRNVALTRAGEEFARSVLVTLGQFELATRAAHDVDGADRPNSLAVSVPTGLGIAWLSGELVAFAEKLGIPDLTLNEAIRAEDVDWETNDAAVVYDNPPFPGLRWRSLGEVRLRTVCSPILFPKLELQHRDRKLNGITLLHEDDGEEWARWAVAARISLVGSGRVKVATIAQAVASAAQGHGIALVSDILARGYLAAGRLIQPFQTSINAARAYYVLCREERSQEPLIQSLFDEIADAVRFDRQ